MRVRVLSAAAGIPIFVGLCLWGALPFALGVLALAVVGLWELARAVRGAGRGFSALAASCGLLGPLGVVLLAMEPSARPEGWPAMLGALAATVLLAALLGEVLHALRTGRNEVGARAGMGLLCGFYVLLFAGLSLLRLPREASGGWLGHDGGAALALTTAIAVWLTDTGAYFVGRARGRRRLAQNVSPNKTVEGALGGLAGGALGGVAAGWLLAHNPLMGLVAGMVAGTIGQMGDLFESAMKRELGLKDLGAIMPGHGGVLDRFDSLLFAAPAVYLALYWLGVV